MNTKNNNISEKTSANIPINSKDPIGNLEKLLVEEKLRSFLQEDIRSGDISSKQIPNKVVQANIIAKSDGIVCGIREVSILLSMAKISYEVHKFDGESVKPKEKIIDLKGYLHDILGVERVLLNIMMRMSAIASSTADLMNILKSNNSKAKVAASRKTTPGFRLFEKRAVEIGGGDTHRFAMDDMVMFKDTHIAASNSKSLESLIKETRKRISFSKKIEIEVENEEMVFDAVKGEPDIIMFDNMAPKVLKDLIPQLKLYIKENGLKQPIFECSGNITHNNIKNYSTLDVDILSTSEITLFPYKFLDISLKIKE